MMRPVVVYKKKKCVNDKKRFQNRSELSATNLKFCIR